jgi:hypothetical protein
VPDDFTHALGDVDEERLNVALGYLERLDCFGARALSADAMRESAVTSRLAAIDGRLRKSPWLQNRTLRR